MNKKIISKINKMLYELELPNINKTRYAHFSMISYKRWALHEIKDLLENNWTKNPFSLLENLAYTFDDIACSAKTIEKSFMFSVAYDTVYEVIDELIIINNKEDK